MRREVAVMRSKALGDELHEVPVVNIPGAPSPQIDALRRLQRQNLYVCVVCTSKVRKLSNGGTCSSIATSAVSVLVLLY